MSACGECGGRLVLHVCERCGVRHYGAAGRTLDPDGWCVRCGAPDLHCVCVDVEDDGHWWVAPSVGANSTKYTICQKCGNIKRADGKPSSRCRGPIWVGLR